MIELAQLRIPGSSTGIPVSSNIPAILKPSPGGDSLNSAGAALISFGFNWLFVLGVFAALVVFMWGGIEWISSQGDPIRIARAKQRILFSIIGVVVIALAFVIVRVIITILGGSNEFFRI